MERQSEGRPAEHGVPCLDMEKYAAGQRGKAMPDMAFDPVAAALRQMHERVVAEPVPDDFLRLLDQLDGSDDGGKEG